MYYCCCQNVVVDRTCPAGIGCWSPRATDQMNHTIVHQIRVLVQWGVCGRVEGHRVMVDGECCRVTDAHKLGSTYSSLVSQLKCDIVPIV